MDLTIQRSILPGSTADKYVSMFIVTLSLMFMGGIVGIVLVIGFTPGGFMGSFLFWVYVLLISVGFTILGWWGFKQLRLRGGNYREIILKGSQLTFKPGSSKVDQVMLNLANVHQVECRTVIIPGRVGVTINTIRPGFVIYIITFTLKDNSTKHVELFGWDLNSLTKLIQNIKNRFPSTEYKSIYDDSQITPLLLERKLGVDRDSLRARWELKS